MQELRFEVEFLSDIVLPATSNTEGKIDDLDFIPGSNFLGMVAREYGSFSDSFAVFHSGKVRFGDAFLVHNGNLTYKMPLSFFHEKLDDSVIVNHHLIKDFSKFTQLKQKRKGFITKDLEEVSIEYSYAQKSAYDKGHRRSKEGAMYGYNAMPKGLIFQFVVKYENVNKTDIEKLKNTLTGKQRLGRSKSSQYGLVEIREIDSLAHKVGVSTSDAHEVCIYVKSRLALVDENGYPTFDLKYLADGLRDENIVWEKSQIRTSTYTPYNSAMKTKTYERMVINPGSVIVLRDIDDETIQKLKNGVGVYLSEGFGELLINPAFLLNELFSFYKSKDKQNNQKQPEITDDTVKFLKAREDRKYAELKLLDSVQEFITKNRTLYKNIKNSQWGTIRSICTAGRENFLEEIKEYISSGKVSWSHEQIKRLTEREDKSLEFIKLLSMKMPQNGDKQ